MPAGHENAGWLDRPGNAIDRLGHYGPTCLTVSIAAIIAVAFDPSLLASTPTLLAAAAIAAFLLVGWRAMRRHDRRLCELCASSMPLNTAEIAARYRLRFRVAHALMAKVLGLSYLAVLISSDVLLMHGELTERIAWAAIQSTMVYLVIAYSSHRRFQPWCQQCHGGNGGYRHDDHRNPVPVAEG